jgi:hypothetical protein
MKEWYDMLLRPDGMLLPPPSLPSIVTKESLAPVGRLLVLEKRFLFLLGKHLGNPNQE